MDQSTTTAVFALAYFSLATLFGESLANWAVSRRRSLVDGLVQATKAIRSTWSPVADIISAGFLNPEAETPEPPQRLRVRIKVP